MHMPLKGGKVKSPSLSVQCYTGIQPWTAADSTGLEVLDTPTRMFVCNECATDKER